MKDKKINKIVDCIKDKKGTDIVILDIKGLSSLTDYFIVCTSDSDPKTRALVNHIKKELSREKIKPTQIEGLEYLDWVLIDYFDTVVHLFKQGAREFYDIERLWADAKITRIEND